MCTLHSRKELQIWKSYNQKERESIKIYNRTRISIPKDPRPMKQQSHTQMLHIIRSAIILLPPTKHKDSETVTGEGGGGGGGEASNQFR
jgi:hypothetical protein